MSGTVNLNAPSYMPALLGSSAPGTSLLSSLRGGGGPDDAPAVPATGAEPREDPDLTPPAQMLTVEKAPALGLVV
jgi:hypothetical protein